MGVEIYPHFLKIKNMNYQELIELDKNLKELFEKLESLKIAYKMKYLSTNEYCTNYNNIYKQIKNLTTK